MKRFVEGMDRGQSTLFPECLEDWICEDYPVPIRPTLPLLPVNDRFVADAIGNVVELWGGNLARAPASKG